MTLMHSFVEDFRRLGERQSEKIAVLDGGGRVLTYRQLSNYVERAQALLFKHGVKSGDTVVALLPNAIETLIMFLASLRGGVTYAPLPCTSTITEVRKWKELTQSRMCLSANSVSNSVQVQLADMEWDSLTISIGGNFDWLSGDSAPSSEVGRVLLASSGSTGDPKAIVLDGDRLWSAGCAFLRYHQLESTDVRFWNYLPMSYLGGLFNLGLIPLAAGGSIFIDEPFSGKTFLTFWSVIERYEVNSLWLVPSILRGLLTLAERVGRSLPPNRVERCYLGTAPIGLAEKQKFSQIFGIEPLENYGLSETTFVSSERSNELSFRKESGVGSIMPGVDIKLSEVDADGEQLNEILVRTPFMMLGYLDSQGHIETPLIEDGFLRSGDYGYVSDGQLIINGRRRDIIKKGGILIFLREIELLAECIDGVLEAAAARLDHPFYGESYSLYIRVKAVIGNEVFLTDQITSQLHEQLARHKWPEHISIVDEFPRTLSGKIQKHLLNKTAD